MQLTYPLRFRWTTLNQKTHKLGNSTARSVAKWRPLPSRNVVKRQVIRESYIWWNYISSRIWLVILNCRKWWRQVKIGNKTGIICYLTWTRIQHQLDRLRDITVQLVTQRQKVLLFKEQHAKHEQGEASLRIIFCWLDYFVLTCTGLQHFVIEPPEPYGMPLNLTTLPQKLKEAGKIESIRLFGKILKKFLLS